MDRRSQFQDINIPLTPIQQFHQATLLQVTFQQSVTLYQLVQESNQLRQQLSQLNQSFKDLISQFSPSTRKINQHRTQVTEPDLLRILCPSHSDFDLSIQMLSSFPQILSKGKIFVLSIQVVPLSEFKISDDFSINLTVKIYSSEEPPRCMYGNKHGHPLIQTDPYQAVVSYNPRKGCHAGNFKARINEVTSHYPNGWVFLVVEAAPNQEMGGLIKVKPLIIKNVVVRAKKPINKIKI